MSYPNYPNAGGYPGYPGGYPPQPQQQPGYPPSQAQYPSVYPPAPVGGGYPAYPPQQAGYPGAYQPGAQQPAYPPPGGSMYPPQVQQQQQYYPTPGPGYSQYNPTGPVPQQQMPSGYPGGPGYGPVPATGPYPPAVAQGSFSYTAQQTEHVIPTVLPASPFDPRADADALHKAMKGLGTNEVALINVLCRRTSTQRAQINVAYKSGYGKDLESKLKSELSGNLENVLVALSLPISDYLAREMHDAVCGIGTNEGTLVEILVSGTNAEIRNVNAAYQRLYGHPMERDIKGDTSGTLKMLLVSLAQGQRDESPTVDYNKAREDAQRLYQAGEAKLGTDESTFNAILATRSWAHLRQVMAEYQAARGHSLEQAVLREFSANAEKGMLGILQCAQNRQAYFAGRLNNAMRGAGTKDKNLIRILVTRCDIDLGTIKLEYQKKYGKSLQADVSSDTSGDYKKALLALIG